MIYDQELQDWLDKCPTHKHEILHSDDDGVVIVFRFNNQREEDEQKDREPSDFNKSLALARGQRLQAASGKLQAPSRKLDKKEL